jgi:hypothetical protein
VALLQAMLRLVPPRIERYGDRLAGSTTRCVRSQRSTRRRSR